MSLLLTLPPCPLGGPHTLPTATWFMEALQGTLFLSTVHLTRWLPGHCVQAGGRPDTRTSSLSTHWVCLESHRPRANCCPACEQRVDAALTPTQR